MGAKGNLTICAYCGRIYPRTDETTWLIKCIPCQKAGKTKLLPLDKFLVKKKEWLERLEHGRLHKHEL